MGKILLKHDIGFRACAIPDIAVLRMHSALLFSWQRVLLDAGYKRWIYKYGPDKFKKLQSKYVSWFIAFKAGEPVGTCAAEIKNGRPLIAALGVAPHAQGKGIGTFLVARTVNECIKYDRYPIWVYVKENNPAAVRVYRKAGFR